MDSILLAIHTKANYGATCWIDVVKNIFIIIFRKKIQSNKS